MAVHQLLVAQVSMRWVLKKLVEAPCLRQCLRHGVQGWQFVTRPASLVLAPAFLLKSLYPRSAAVHPLQAQARVGLD